MSPGASIQARIITAIGGTAGAVLMGLMLFLPGQAQRALGSCLVAWLYFLDISLGSLALLMLQRLTGGRWIGPVRPYLRAALAPLPMLLLLFLPVIIAAFQLFPWSRGMGDGGPMAFKAAYLAAWPFTVRSLLALGAWCALAWVLRRGAGPGAGFSAAGLIVYAVTVTWSAVDWIASLEPRWASSILGLLIFTGHGLAALAFATLCVTRWPTAGRRAPAQECGDLGNLLLTFVMSWAYLSFMQFLIVWAEDLPRETVWYVPRVLHSWRYLTVAVFFSQFAIPFSLLLVRRIKRRPAALGAIALLLMVAHGLYVFWLIVPTLAPAGWDLSWTDLAALICVGVPWMWIFMRDVRGDVQAAPAGALHVH
jgi:hypothetical protein